MLDGLPPLPLGVQDRAAQTFKLVRSDGPEHVRGPLSPEKERFSILEPTNVRIGEVNGKLSCLVDAS